MSILVITIPQALTLRLRVVLQALEQELGSGGRVGCKNDVKTLRIGFEETQCLEPNRLDTLAGMQRRNGVRVGVPVEIVTEVRIYPLKQSGCV
jgi:hypothetical protein